MNDDGHSVDEVRAMETCRATERLINGEDHMRYAYARRVLGVTQAHLAAMLEMAPETISRFENGAVDVPAMYKFALIGLLSVRLRATGKSLSA